MIYWSRQGFQPSRLGLLLNRMYSQVKAGSDG